MDCDNLRNSYDKNKKNSSRAIGQFTIIMRQYAISISFTVVILINLSVNAYGNRHELDSIQKLLNSPTLAVYKKIDILNLLSRTYLYVSSEKAIEYGNRALTLSIEQSYKIGQAYAYRNLAGAYSFMGDFVLSAKYVKNALTIFEEQRDSIGIANCYISLGHMYRYRKNHIREIFYHKKSYELFNRLKIDDRMGVAAHNLGESYFNNQEFEKARDFTAIAIRIN